MKETIIADAPLKQAAPDQHILRDSLHFDWSKQTLGADLMLVLPIAICLAGGIVAGHPAAGMIAAGGAANTGFGQKHRIDDTYLLPMIFVTFGMAVAGFLGVLIGHGSHLMVVVSVILGFLYGMSTGRPEGYGWVGQQCVTTYLVASAFPAPLEDATARGLLLLLGGVVQLVLSSMLLHVFGELSGHLFTLTRYVREEQEAMRATLWAAADDILRLRLKDATLLYSLRLAAVIGLGTEIYRHLNYPSGYWIPMTAMLVLKPGLNDTVSRAVARLLGTMGGAIAVSFFLAHVAVHPWLLAFCAVVFAWLSYGLLNVNYAVFTMSITGYIVFLLALDQIPGHDIAVHRTFCTAVGGAIALSVRLIMISWYRRQWKRAAVRMRQVSAWDMTPP